MIGLTVFAAFASADPAEDISSKQNQMETIRAELDEMNMGLVAKVESYNQANYELGRIQETIAENEDRLEETNANLAEAQSRLEKRVENIYRNGSVGIIDVLMETSDINEFMTKFDLLAKVGEQDQNDLEQIKDLKAQVEEAQTQLAEDQAAQAELLSQIEFEKSSIESTIAERQSMLTGIEGEIATLEQQRQAAEQQQAAAVAADYSSDAGSGGGGGGGGYGPAPPSTAGGAAGIAMQYLGVPYVWGGADPSGFDCSGLVMYVYGQMGISLPHYTGGQWNAGTHIDPSELQPGDLVFFYGVSHVGIYIGGGSMIHAPYPGASVEISGVDYGSMDGAVRI